MTAVYGRSDEVSRQRHALDMQIRMKVNVEQADLPSGLARLLNLMDATGGLTRLPPAEVDESPEVPETPDDAESAESDSATADPDDV